MNKPQHLNSVLVLSMWGLFFLCHVSFVHAESHGIFLFGAISSCLVCHNFRLSLHHLHHIKILFTLFPSSFQLLLFFHLHFGIVLVVVLYPFVFFIIRIVSSSPFAYILDAWLLICLRCLPFPFLYYHIDSLPSFLLTSKE